MFNPFNFLYKTTRFEIIKIVGRIIVAPFKPVKFRDFFLADVITSAKLILIDSSATFCFYSSGEY